MRSFKFVPVQRAGSRVGLVGVLSACAGVYWYLCDFEVSKEKNIATSVYSTLRKEEKQERS